MLAHFRFRLLLIALLWVATVAAVVLWLGGKQNPELTLAAGSKGSETHTLATAIAERLSESGELRVTVFETGGTAENLALLAAGQIDLAMTQADSLIPEQALGVARLFPDAYHLIVNADAGIGHFSDLRGRRVAIPPKASAQNASFWFLADHYGVAADDIGALPMSADAASFALQQGQVDALFKVRAPGNPEITRLIKSGELELVPLRQADALSLKQPALRDGIIPKGSYRGFPPLPAEHLPTAILDRLLVARDDVPPHLVYKFTREMFEARSDLAHRFPLAGFIAPLEQDANSAIPAHPGARRYFDREKPSVLQQNARFFSAMLYAIVIIGSGMLALRARWQRSRRIRMGDFNARLMAIAESTRGNEDYSSLLDSKNQLMDILREVVNDLDSDRVSQEEFEHFSFTWQAVDAMLRDQIVLVGHSAREELQAQRGRAYG